MMEKLAELFDEEEAPRGAERAPRILIRRPGPAGGSQRRRGNEHGHPGVDGTGAGAAARGGVAGAGTLDAHRAPHQRHAFAAAAGEPVQFDVLGQGAGREAVLRRHGARRHQGQGDHGRGARPRRSRAAAQRRRPLPRLAVLLALQGQGRARGDERGRLRRQRDRQPRVRRRDGAARRVHPRRPLPAARRERAGRARQEPRRPRRRGGGARARRQADRAGRRHHHRHARDRQPGQGRPVLGSRRFGPAGGRAHARAGRRRRDRHQPSRPAARPRLRRFGGRRRPDRRRPQPHAAVEHRAGRRRAVPGGRQVAVGARRADRPGLRLHPLPRPHRRRVRGREGRVVVGRHDLADPGHRRGPDGRRRGRAPRQSRSTRCASASSAPPRRRSCRRTAARRNA